MEAVETCYPEGRPVPDPTARPRPVAEGFVRAEL